MPFTATCRVCGANKNPEDYSANECAACRTMKIGAETAFREANPEASESDVLYAGRVALNGRAHHAHRNFVDPRQHASVRGMIPIPPQIDRGNPGA